MILYLCVEVYRFNLGKTKIRIWGGGADREVGFDWVESHVVNLLIFP